MVLLSLSYDRTVCLAAYYRDDVAVVKLLCGKGANVNSKDEVILLLSHPNLIRLLLVILLLSTIFFKLSMICMYGACRGVMMRCIMRKRNAIGKWGSSLRSHCANR